MQAFNIYYSLSVDNRGRIQRLFFVLVFAILLYKCFSGLLVHQIGENPILYQEVDIVYWLFMIAGIPDFISGNVALSFDILLLTTSLISFTFPRQNISTVIFCVCYFIYFILFNMTAGHHFNNVGILILSFPFIFKTLEFGFCWKFARFTFMFIMFSAGVWKIVRGNFSHPHQLAMIILNNKVSSLAMGEKTIQNNVIRWLIQHPFWPQLVWDILIILELSFVWGFFTLKKDGFLMVNYLLFFAGGLLLTGIFNIENFLFLLTLLPVLRFIAKRPGFNAVKA